MSRVLVVGDLVTDVLAGYTGALLAGSDTPARIRLTGGGSAANTAAWLATTGRPVTFVGVTGADPAGAELVAALCAGGVDCAVRRAGGAATGTVVVLSTPAERTMLFDRGANALLAPADIDAALAGAPGAVHLHLSGYALFDPGTRPAARYALRAAAAAGLSTSVDAASAGPLARAGAAAFRDWVAGTGVLLANEDEARVLTGTGPGTLVPPYRLLPPAGQPPVPGDRAGVVLKRGAAGAAWAGRDGTAAEVPAEPVPVVDPTGAGDAFAAGFLHAWLAAAGPVDALRAGTRLGAAAVARAGARPGPVAQ